MAVKRDYYDVLGIDRNADEKTIKKIIDIKLPIEFTREEISALIDKIYKFRFFEVIL